MRCPAGPEVYRDAVAEWLVQNELEYDGSSNSFHKNGCTIDNGTLAARVHFDLARIDLTERKLLVALNYAMADAREQLVEDVRNDLGAGVDDDTIEVLVAHLMPAGVDADARANASCAMRHWIQNVKRALHGLPQRDHLMLIFYGEQGGGKSSFVARLLSPLKTLASRDTFAIFNDPFAATRAHYSYAVFLDEMNHVSRSDAAVLKEGISTPTVGGRKMHSEQSRRLVRNASYIAATNVPPPHGLHDETGARRFFSIECADSLSGVRGHFLRTFNAERVWDSVDVEARSPLSERLGAIRKVQREELQARSVLDNMLDECTTRGSDRQAFLLVADLCRRLKRWQDDHNMRGPVLTVKQAVPLLRRAGLTVVNHHGHNKALALTWSESETDLLSSPVDGPRDRPGRGRPYLHPVPG